MIKMLLYFLFFLFTISCNESNLKLIKKASYPNLKEERLGQSIYHVKYPPTMFIEETRGKEGQVGYGLWQIDSTMRYKSFSGFIEIEHGNPIGEQSDIENTVEKVRSIIHNKSVVWKIGITETGYYEATAFWNKLTLNASALTREGLDSMIAILSTLSSR